MPGYHQSQGTFYVQLLPQINVISKWDKNKCIHQIKKEYKEVSISIKMHPPTHSHDNKNNNKKVN